ncbi:MAG: CDGSH iron-sulfur domain-containing protein [Actinomycetota bacterium]
MAYREDNERCSIQPSDNGPLLIRGAVKLIDPEGNEFEVKGKNIALCRCGASADKPFCDGSHKRIDFQSVVRAQVPALTTARGVGDAG